VFYLDVAYMFHVCCNYIFQMFHLFLSRIFALKCFMLYEESGVLRNAVQRAYGRGHDALGAIVRGTMGPRCPCRGEVNEWGWGRGCGRVKHKRGHFDGSEAHVQCVRDGLGHPQWEFHDTVSNTLIF